MDSITKDIMRCVREIGASFRNEDDDWYPVLILERDGKRNSISVPFSGPQDKERFAEAIPQIFKAAKPTFAAFVVSAWVLRVDGNDANSEKIINDAMDKGISKHPSRAEVVIVVTATPEDGENEYYAPIERRKDKPPTLGAFAKSEHSKSEGRFANLLSRGFEAME